MVSLLVDDVRILDTDFTARSYDDAVEILSTQEIDTLFLDHDYGDPDPRKNGSGLIRWLTMNTEHLPKKIVLVTQNPVGEQNIRAHLSSLKKSKGIDIPISRLETA